MRRPRETMFAIVFLKDVVSFWGFAPEPCWGLPSPDSLVPPTTRRCVCPAYRSSFWRSKETHDASHSGVVETLSTAAIDRSALFDVYMTDSGDMATESGRKHNGTPVADLSSEKHRSDHRA